MDHLLVQATLEGYRKIRTPGKYEYDKSRGEITIDEYNDLLDEEFKRRFQNFIARGHKFPPKQLDEYLEYHKKNPYNRASAQRSCVNEAKTTH